MTEIQNDIIPRLRACADGMGSLKSPKGDYGLCDDAADEIERLRAECQRHAEVMEDVRKVLESSDALLKRLMHVHVAPDECTSYVADSQRWFYDNGGTLACLADQFEAIRALLSRLEDR